MGWYNRWGKHILIVEKIKYSNYNSIYIELKNENGEIGNITIKNDWTSSYGMKIFDIVELCKDN